MRTERGFTMIEVLMAVTILALVVLGMATVTGSFIRTVSDTDYETVALQLAEDRIEEIRMDPQYGQLANYQGTETGFATLAGFTRETTVTQITGAGGDYTKITVEVAGPGLTIPISRSITVGAP